MKKIKNILAIVLAAMTLMSTFNAFAYTNSMGTDTNDINIMSDNSYTVTGNDTTQGKKTEYQALTYADQEITSACDVYATVAEGSKVYDPTNPEADENGFVDGSIVIGVPTTMIISGTPTEDGWYVAEANYKVKGNISGTTVVKVVAEKSFEMTQQGKDNVTVTATQDYTRFVVPTSPLNGDNVNKHVTPTFNDNAVGTITAKTQALTAGSWVGATEFNISVTTYDEYEEIYGQKIKSWNVSATEEDDVWMTYYDTSQIVNLPITTSISNLFSPMVAYAAEDDSTLTEIETYEDGTIIIKGDGNIESDIYNYFFDVEQEQYDCNMWIAQHSEYAQEIQVQGFDLATDPLVVFTGHFTYKTNGNSEVYKYFYNKYGSAFTSKCRSGSNLNDGFPYYWGKTIDRTTYDRFKPSKIIIQEGVTNIPMNAFRECKELTSVSIPSTVTVISNNAFYNCNKLTDVQIEYGVQKIHQWAFGYCDSLEEIILPESVTYINGAFTGCTSLKEFVFPDSITWIEGYYMFAGCESLESVTFPSNAKYNNNHSFFQECSSLKEVQLPENFKFVNNTFYKCTALEKVNIPTEITDLGVNAFWQCTALESIYIPDNITSLGGGTFMSCTSLKEVYIPASVISIFCHFNDLPVGSVIYCENGTIASKFTTSRYNPEKTAVIVDPTKFE